MSRMVDDMDNELQPDEMDVASGTPPTSMAEKRFLRDLCVRIWRAEKRLQEIIGQRGDDVELERLGRRFGEVVEVLEQYDCEILDHTNQKYDPGLTLRVLDFEQRNDVNGEVIIETVKPTLRLRGTVEPGEVIVARPKQED